MPSFQETTQKEMGGTNHKPGKAPYIHGVMTDHGIRHGHLVTRNPHLKNIFDSNGHIEQSTDTSAGASKHNTDVLISKSNEVKDTHIEVSRSKSLLHNNDSGLLPASALHGKSTDSQNSDGKLTQIDILSGQLKNIRLLHNKLSASSPYRIVTDGKHMNSEDMSHQRNFPSDRMRNTKSNHESKLLHGRLADSVTTKASSHQDSPINYPSNITSYGNNLDSHSILHPPTSGPLSDSPGGLSANDQVGVPIANKERRSKNAPDLQDDMSRDAARSSQSVPFYSKERQIQSAALLQTIDKQDAMAVSNRGMYKLTLLWSFYQSLYCF